MPTRKSFLRSTSAPLIQTLGRAARHLEGRAPSLYADKMTDSMRRAIGETDRRRAVQLAYNEENNITPQSIINKMDMGLAQILKAEYGDIEVEAAAEIPEFNTQADLDTYIAKLESDMREAARKFEFEKAAKLRDSIKKLPRKGDPLRVAPAICASAIAAAAEITPSAMPRLRRLSVSACNCEFSISASRGEAPARCR